MRALLDFRVHLRSESFLPIILAQVTVRLGELPRPDPGIFERLSPADLRLLESLYREMNGYPALETSFTAEVAEESRKRLAEGERL